MQGLICSYDFSYFQDHSIRSLSREEGKGNGSGSGQYTGDGCCDNGGETICGTGYGFGYGGGQGYDDGTGDCDDYVPTSTVYDYIGI